MNSRKVAAGVLAISLMATGAKGCKQEAQCYDSRNTKTTRDDKIVPKLVCEKPHSRRYYWATPK